MYVVVFHSKFILWSGGREYLRQFPRDSWKFWDYLNFGITLSFSSGVQMVMIFFVLSGFFISMSLDKKSRSFYQKLKTFYTVRAIRIYVPYLMSIALAVSVLILSKILSPGLFNVEIGRELNTRLPIAFSDLTVYNFLKSVIFLFNEEYIGFNLVYWSLLYEGIFYLIVPFVQLIMKEYLIISTILFALGVTLPYIFDNGNPLIRYVFQYNFYFALGQALFHYRSQISGFLGNKNFKVYFITASLLMLIIFNVLVLAKFKVWANLLAACSGALLMVTFLNYKINNNYFIQFITFLGKISYSLYLVHIPVLLIIYSLIHSLTGKTVLYAFEYLLGCIISIPVGWLFYVLAEAPSIQWIKKVKHKISGDGHRIHTVSQLKKSMAMGG